MARQLILGTAGHIDHGKTALVRALTGVDTDRLPEEKRRGMTIDIGFARLNVDDSELGIVDVPGHEKFIRNMLAGASGMDLAMLVVAADDAVMPQTREHLEILELLDVKHGVIALTKCDLVDESLQELAEQDIRELVAGTFLASAPIVRTSATTDLGMDDLRQALCELCQRAEPRPTGDLFRLAVDRSFVIQGQGTVVTGSVASGAVRVGDEVQWLPSGKILRIRSLESHGRRDECVHRGQRAAIGLSGVHHREILRGHELATPGYLKPTRMVTAQLRVPASSPSPVKHRATVRVHIGTASVIAIVSLLTENNVEPGQAAQAQLFLSEPIIAVCGQPFVIRRLSPVTTLGGGHVLQPVAERLSRCNAKALRHVQALRSADDAKRAAAAALFYGVSPWTDLELCRDANLSTAQAAAVLDRLEADGVLVVLPLGHGRAARLHRDVLRELERRIMSTVEQYHKNHPLDMAMPRNQLAEQVRLKDCEPVLAGIVRRLAETGRVDLRDVGIAMAGFAPDLTTEQQAVYDDLVAAYRSAGFQPPPINDLADQAMAPVSLVRQLIRLAVERRQLVYLGGSVYLHVESEQELRRRVGEALCTSPGLTVSQIRKMLGTSRKFAVPFCEYLDRIGLTKRQGDQRVLAAPITTEPSPPRQDRAAAGGANDVLPGTTQS